MGRGMQDHQIKTSMSIKRIKKSASGHVCMSSDGMSSGEWRHVEQPSPPPEQKESQAGVRADGAQNKRQGEDGGRGGWGGGGQGLNILHTPLQI